MSTPPLGNDRRLLARGCATNPEVRSKIIFTLLLLGALWSLSGCQGLSTSSTNPTKQSQSGTISLTSSSLAFGSVKAGSSKAISTTATNSGSATVTITSVAISTKYFQVTAPSLPVTLTAGQSVPLSVVFTPNAAGTFNASISISSDATDSVTTVTLSGTGTAVIDPIPGKLALNPAAASFGDVTVGSSRSSALTLTNTGETSVDVSQVSVSGAGFHMSGLATSTTVEASQSITFSVAFAPQAAGSATGSVTIASNASDPTLTIPLSGTGTNTTTPTAQLGVTPTTLSLGNVVVGTSGTASGSLSASGGSVTVTGASSSNSAFVIGGLSLPVTIPAGQSIPFTITFSPQVSGTAGATLTFASNAQPSSTAESLTGSGTPAPTYTVNLSWAASSSANISGYNIYRAPYTTSCGAFKRLNSQLNTGTLYSDSTVADGASYCYATTAVNSSSGESGYSNIVSNLQIPAP